MQRFIMIRVFHAFIALVAVSLIIFSLARLSGDPLDTMLDIDATEEDEARLRAYWGLDQPLHVQYFTYLGNVVTGNMGESLRWQGQDAMGLLLQRLPATLELAFFSLIVSVVLALPIGVIVAVKKDTGIDIAGKIFALFGQSMPSFALGLLLMWIFAVQLGWLPTSGRGSFFFDVGQPEKLILPAVSLGYFQVAAIMRLTRSSMLEVLDTEYVKLARIKGISETKVIWKHCLRNALTAPLTYFGLILGGFMTGSVVTETIFTFPGIGLLAIDAVRAKDFQVIQTVVVFFAGIYIVANLLVDILYAYMDPRIRYA
ncbi:MAG: ABC transporter permease [Chloroflexi bacterium]|nr:ABC transporter permease [Chloroflexota bacterium]